jgi:hypothetical protein
MRQSPQGPWWERLLTRAFIAFLFAVSCYALWMGLTAAQDTLG